MFPFKLKILNNFVSRFADSIYCSKNLFDQEAQSPNSKFRKVFD